MTFEDFKELCAARKCYGCSTGSDVFPCKSCRMDNQTAPTDKPQKHNNYVENTDEVTVPPIRGTPDDCENDIVCVPESRDDELEETSEAGGHCGNFMNEAAEHFTVMQEENDFDWDVAKAIASEEAIGLEAAAGEQHEMHASQDSNKAEDNAKQATKMPSDQNMPTLPSKLMEDTEENKYLEETVFQTTANIFLKTAGTTDMTAVTQKNYKQELTLYIDLQQEQTTEGQHKENEVTKKIEKECHAQSIDLNDTAMVELPGESIEDKFEDSKVKGTNQLNTKQSANLDMTEHVDDTNVEFNRTAQTTPNPNSTLKTSTDMCNAAQTLNQVSHLDMAKSTTLDPQSLHKGCSHLHRQVVMGDVIALDTHVIQPGVAGVTNSETIMVDGAHPHHNMSKIGQAMSTSDTLQQSEKGSKAEKQMSQKQLSTENKTRHIEDSENLSTHQMENTSQSSIGKGLQGNGKDSHDTETKENCLHCKNGEEHKVCIKEEKVNISAVNTKQERETNQPRNHVKMDDADGNKAYHKDQEKETSGCSLQVNNIANPENDESGYYSNHMSSFESGDIDTNETGVCPTNLQVPITSEEDCKGTPVDSAENFSVNKSPEPMQEAKVESNKDDKFLQENISWTEAKYHSSLIETSEVPKTVCSVTREPQGLGSSDPNSLISDDNSISDAKTAEASSNANNSPFMPDKQEGIEPHKEITALRKIEDYSHSTQESQSSNMHLHNGSEDFENTAGKSTTTTGPDQFPLHCSIEASTLTNIKRNETNLTEQSQSSNSSLMKFETINHSSGNVSGVSRPGEEQSTSYQGDTIYQKDQTPISLSSNDASKGSLRPNESNTPGQDMLEEAVPPVHEDNSKQTGMIVIEKLVCEKFRFHFLPWIQTEGEQTELSDDNLWYTYNVNTSTKETHPSPMINTKEDFFQFLADKSIFHSSYYQDLNNNNQDSSQQTSNVLYNANDIRQTTKPNLCMGKIKETPNDIVVLNIMPTSNESNHSIHTTIPSRSSPSLQQFTVTCTTTETPLMGASTGSPSAHVKVKHSETSWAPGTYGHTNWEDKDPFHLMLDHTSTTTHSQQYQDTSCAGHSLENRQNTGKVNPRDGKSNLHACDNLINGHRNNLHVRKTPNLQMQMTDNINPSGHQESNSDNDQGLSSLENTYYSNDLIVHSEQPQKQDIKVSTPLQSSSLHLNEAQPEYDSQNLHQLQPTSENVHHSCDLQPKEELLQNQARKIQNEVKPSGVEATQDLHLENRTRKCNQSLSTSENVQQTDNTQASYEPSQHNRVIMDLEPSDPHPNNSDTQTGNDLRNQKQNFFILKNAQNTGNMQVSDKTLQDDTDMEFFASQINDSNAKDNGKRKQYQNQYTTKIEPQTCTIQGSHKPPEHQERESSNGMNEYFQASISNVQSENNTSGDQSLLMSVTDHHSGSRQTSHPLRGSKDRKVSSLQAHSIDAQPKIDQRRNQSLPTFKTTCGTTPPQYPDRKMADQKPNSQQNHINNINNEVGSQPYNDSSSHTKISVGPISKQETSDNGKYGDDKDDKAQHMATDGVIQEGFLLCRYPNKTTKHGRTPSERGDTKAIKTRAIGGARRKVYNNDHQQEHQRATAIPATKQCKKWTQYPKCGYESPAKSQLERQFPYKKRKLNEGHEFSQEFGASAAAQHMSAGPQSPWQRKPSPVRSKPLKQNEKCRNLQDYLWDISSACVPRSQEDISHQLLQPDFVPETDQPLANESQADRVRRSIQQSQQVVRDAIRNCRPPPRPQFLYPHALPQQANVQQQQQQAQGPGINLPDLVEDSLLSWRPGGDTHSEPDVTSL